MAKAYKCDCCKKCFDPTDYPEDLFIQFETGCIFKGKNSGIAGLNGKYENFLNRVDLCKDCSGHIISLLNQHKENVDEKDNKADDPLADFDKSVNDFLKDIGSRGAAILRDFVYGNSNGKTSERKSGTKQDGSD